MYTALKILPLGSVKRTEELENKMKIFNINE
jgi:hypothetical protein